MADFDSKLPVRALAVDFTTEVADSAGTTINPAKEDGNLATIAGDTTSIDSKLNTLGQKPSTGSVPVVIANDQSSIPFTIDEGNTDEVSYDTQAALATSASDTHSFTPAADLRVKKIQASASGQMKIEVKWGITGGETTKHVSFTSKGDLTIQIEWPDGIFLTSADTIQVIRTNTDNQAMDVYSSIVYQLD